MSLSQFSAVFELDAYLKMDIPNCQKCLGDMCLIYNVYEMTTLCFECCPIRI